MDGTELFVKMCEMAEEIQKRHPDALFLNTLDSVNLPEYDLNGNCWFNKNNKKIIWLPGQDQLQEMVKTSNELWTHTLNRFYDYYTKEAQKNHEWCLVFDTPEKMWLAFCMKTKYSKIWNGNDWIPETTH